jgi:hypothetical protein
VKAAGLPAAISELYEARAGVEHCLVDENGVMFYKTFDRADRGPTPI